MRVEAWLSRAARRRPERAAVDATPFAALDAAAAGVARALAADGVRPGERLAIALPPGEDFAVALHAAWKLGCPVVPMDPRDPHAPTAGARHTISELPRPSAAGAPLLATHDLDAPAAILHTSGSTGTPKEVELSFGNLLWSALGSGVALGVDPAERWLCALPLHHVGGLSIVVRSAIYATTALVHERWDTGRVLEALRSEGVTLVSLVPTTLTRLLDGGLREPPALRTVLLGGAPIAPALADRARAAGVAVTETYGLTEACSQVTTGGPPLFCTRVRIAAGGEIVVSGPTVAGGGELHTGDLGALDEHGHLRVTGRRSDTIVTGGENVAPAEVEAVLAEHPAVAEAAVHARPDPEWGEAVVATVVLRPGAAAGADELRAHAAARLAPYKVPKAVAFADELPRTPSGKLLRGRL
jgi:O-succinylbenzoic acid--CoA ligase